MTSGHPGSEACAGNITVCNSLPESPQNIDILEGVSRVSINAIYLVNIKA
jgi:hypothetical protein